MSVRVRDSKSNRQLLAGELQIECERGAVSVYRPPVTPVQCDRPITVTCVRGIYGRKAQIAQMTVEQARELIRLLEVATEDFDDPQ